MYLIWEKYGSNFRNGWKSTKYIELLKLPPLGLVERFNYIIASSIRTSSEWAQIDNILYNIVPLKGINFRILIEIFSWKSVDRKYLKVFGCIAYYKDYSQKRVKFITKGIPGVLLGFNNESHCYIIMDKFNYTINLDNEVVFEEQTSSALKMWG